MVGQQCFQSMREGLLCSVLSARKEWRLNFLQVGSLSQFGYTEKIWHLIDMDVSVLMFGCRDNQPLAIPPTLCVCSLLDPSEAMYYIAQNLWGDLSVWPLRNVMIYVCPLKYFVLSLLRIFRRLV